MIIHSIGNGGFRLQSGEFTVLIDPTGNRMKSDITLFTSVPANLERPSSDEISFAGEYEVGGVEVRGWTLPQESDHTTIKTAYRIVWEDIIISVLSAVSQLPETALLKNFSDTEVLLIVTDAKHRLSPDNAAKLIHQLEPNISLTPTSKDTSELAKTLGNTAETTDKLVFKKKELIEKKSNLVILTE